MSGRHELSSSQRGLGAAHRRQRRALLAALVDGTPCPLCCRPMYRTQELDADHSRPRSLAGRHVLADRLTHATCNRSRGNGTRRVAVPEQRAPQPTDPGPSRRW